MYISINYVDINIYPLTMECNAPLSMFIWKGRNIKWQYYYYYIIIIRFDYIWRLVGWIIYCLCRYCWMRWIGVMFFLMRKEVWNLLHCLTRWCQLIVFKWKRTAAVAAWAYDYCSLLDWSWTIFLASGEVTCLLHFTYWTCLSKVHLWQILLKAGWSPLQLTHFRGWSQVVSPWPSMEHFGDLEECVQLFLWCANCWQPKHLKGLGVLWLLKNLHLFR